MASASRCDPLVIVSQVMELMEGGDLRKALWQNKEEYAWDRCGGQVLLCIPAEAVMPLKPARSCWQHVRAEAPATAVLSSGLARRWRWILPEVCTFCTHQA
jgi:hypothetical protein